MDVKNLLKLILPTTSCVNCGGHSLKDYPGLCRDCLDKIMDVRDHLLFCRRCGVFYPDTCYHCPQCFDKARPVYTKEGVFSALPYDYLCRNLVIALKYQNRKDVAETMARLFLEYNFTELKERGFDSIVPVPLHKNRLKERGYNQSELLTEYIGEGLSLPVENLLVRVKDIQSQTRLDLEQRRINPHGAFALKEGVLAEGKKILLIDDILTTGATSLECRRILKVEGAKAVAVGTFGAAHSRKDK